MRDIREIINDLNTFQFGQYSTDRIAELAEELDEHPEARVAIGSVLKLFEKYPDEDFGMPGPLAHVIEKYYRDGYEDELALSLKRFPTSITVWLANRITNATGDNSQRFVDILRAVAINPNIDEQLRSEILNFNELH